MRSREEETERTKTGTAGRTWDRAGEKGAAGHGRVKLHRAGQGGWWISVSWPRAERL